MSDTLNPGMSAGAERGAEEVGGRDGRGRFTRGNKGGPGNPFARRVAALRQAVLERVSEQDLAEVVGAMLERAKGGDVAAARLVLAYAVGRPAPAVEPDRLDVEEVALFTEESIGEDGVMAPARGVPAGVVCGIHRAIVPVLAEEVAAQMYEKLRSEDAVAARAAVEAGRGTEGAAVDRVVTVEKTTAQEKSGAEEDGEIEGEGAAVEKTVDAGGRRPPMANGDSGGDGEKPYPGGASASGRTVLAG